MPTNALPPLTDSPEALARALALFVISDATIHPAEIDTLEDLDAFRRIGLSKPRFMELAREMQQRMEADRRSAPDLGSVEAVMAAVRSPELRLLVARLAAAVVTADGRVEGLERMVYDHMLLRWGLSQSRVAQAIREDRMPA
ncbi:MAG: TerB family tellurite resistance protein [Rubrivivax sp.]|nr:TerB family tellurite resistance protein [Rubrivivax sp.]